MIDEVINMNDININDIIEINVDDKLALKYIKYYFYEMVKLSHSKEVFTENFKNSFISILKDDIDRKLNGSGKLREKPWSNFLFYFIDLNDYKALFGTNEKHRDLRNIDSKGIMNLTQYDYNYNSKNPNLLYLHSSNNFKLAKYIFDKIKNEESFLFVRSYVYITIILFDEKIPTKNNFLTFYFNTNYKFTETNGKTNFISNVINSYLVNDIKHELSIIEDNNRDIFDCVKAYNNTIDYTNLTENNLKNIIDAINKKNEYILVEGSARTGKTILAMSLLRLYPQSNLLVMNYYFYEALKDAFSALGLDFPSDRIYHQAFGKKGHYKDMNFDFSIIDECQRLGNQYNIINEIMLSPNHITTIFLGDNLQRLKPSSDDGIAYIKNKILENDKELMMFKFSSSVGIPPEILKNVKFLLSDPTIISPHFLGEYEIKIYDDENSFLLAYEKDVHKNKHLATIHYPNYNFKKIGKYSAFPKELVNSNYPYFLNKQIIDNFYLSPFELISREVESIYVYIRDTITDKNLTGFAYFQLYVLMTRATISLNIFCQNKDLEIKFNEKLSQIKQYSLNYEESIERCVKNGQFNVSENLLDQFTNIYMISSPKEKINERCITRLVHFTDISNIESIIKNGILPRNQLKEGEYDFNDEDRWDKHTDAICLSVENPNSYLLTKFKEKYPNKKYKLITINPSILYSSFIKNDSISLVPRYYCNYNAASKMTKTSCDNIEIMFSPQVQTCYGIFCRKSKKTSQPTMDQAEILFFGKIPPEYIESIEDI